MPSSISLRRFWFANCFIVFLFFLIAYQVFQLTWVHQSSLQQVAEKQHRLVVDIPALRGRILDRAGKEFASNLKVPSIYAVPRQVSGKDKEALALKVGQILKLDTVFVRERFARDKSFVWLKRKVTAEEAQTIRQLKNPGLGILEEYKRIYPQGDLLAQVLGFTDIDGRGLEGIELSLNRDLEGRPGRRFTKRDALGNEIRAFEKKVIAPVHGHQIYLTVDQYLQYLTERALDRAFHDWKAKGAAAVLMEAKTGKILAIANRPTFNPNEYDKSLPDARRNRAITDMYEPGSVFKIVPGSAALNEGLVTFDKTFDCENGEYRYGSRVLHDVHPYGLLTFPEVLIKSSNIGTVKVAALLAPDIFYRYIQGFGFGVATGIDLPGEAPGFIRPPSQWSATSPYNIPMGQETMVTALQMTTAIAVIANGGNLVRPFILSKIEDNAGVRLSEKKPEVVRQGVIRPETALAMRAILVRAVEEGTGKKAQINGISVGGKTGTAQKVLPGGRGYSHNNFMSSFIGFAPAEDPELVMAVVVDDPRPLYYGGVVAAPVFKEVMEAGLLAAGYLPQEEKTSTGLRDVRESSPVMLAPKTSGQAI